jgi:hypothetical protein
MIAKISGIRTQGAKTIPNRQKPFIPFVGSVKIKHPADIPINLNSRTSNIKNDKIVLKKSFVGFLFILN